VKWDSPDAYCYPGTTVLRNHLDLTDANELATAELAIVGLRSFQLSAHPPQPPHNLNCLLGIHRTLFGKLYPFAGKFRMHTGRMTKTRASGYAVVYGDSAFIPQQIDLMFNALAAEKYLVGLSQHDFAQRAAYFYSEFDAIHPFREGNSRTLRLFFSGVAKAAGFQLAWHVLAAANLQQQLYAARDRAVMHGDTVPLTALFSSILSPQ
jgi:cell filamentation protein